MSDSVETQASDKLEWGAYEHDHKDNKTQDWFWALGFVAVAIALAAILLGNVLFAILILLAAAVLAMSVNQEREERAYAITTRGIIIDDELHPYKNLESFWIDESSHPDRDMLIIDAQKPLVPHIIIRLPNSVDKNALQDYLLDYLPEEELHEPVSQRLAELFGF
jgi:hypothetical protein